MESDEPLVTGVFLRSVSHIEQVEEHSKGRISILMLNIKLERPHISLGPWMKLRKRNLKVL